MGIRIGPVRLSSRGARVSIGPRIARVHVGAGRTGFSSGLGPVSVSTSGGRRRAQRAPQQQWQPAYRAPLPPVNWRIYVGLAVFGVVTLAVAAALVFTA